MNKKIVIAGSRSGVGKTTLALGLMAALKKQGLKVQPFKVGPDYIDPGFHTLICGRNSYNLDSYFLGAAGVRRTFLQNSQQADISLVEGVMGLFDGKGKDSVSSTAEIAKTIKAPVILVIDARKVAQSAAAVVYGYKNYDPDLNLKGVIINNVSSPHHFKLLKEAVEAKMSDLKILGYLPKNQDLELPERHLGLVPVTESRELEIYIQKLTELMEEYIDLEGIIEISESDDLIEIDSAADFSSGFKDKIKKAKIKIAVALDQAFNFYYQANLELLKAAGAEIIEISPLNDSQLPEVDAAYFGGGFPESFLEELALNKEFKNDLKEKISEGLPIYAECGGLMYLSSQVKDFEGNIYQMLDLIPAEIEMTSKLQEMGYREIEASADNLLLNKGEKARGHVFHYSKISKIEANVKRKYSYRKIREGYSTLENILASYVHLHFASNPEMVNNFLLKALAYQKSGV
ncbi:cobyrinic acid a,c-diamide synthase [Halanaerobium saccharolyticum]|uniref:Cobyrinate a,c-diamide synthase n=1 Tax=Halanaerobium saccharolyticum TaxID=43595 RepID=A0A4R7Z7C9_9FIRM|nr:cobyrinate a,c-diamide synthase [Halanaerobium saccharolyticum]RAK10577.1 cobyrinic acid a,c-diamide synthase [Halanaerobium saccharolyticum]TDW06666.1 cobyrinic acid a,c-diamide synthase [Halanaerobium saccharolyticum]TDX62301.1 cobyrinic acid a,c-diamide synthase [Halanaerobium saccharolyticum]